jgi:hypothetical protein
VSERVEFAEDGVPTLSIAENASELIEMFGGSIDAVHPDSLEFRLPVRRGVAASGAIACSLTWEPLEEGRVTIRGDADVEYGRGSRIAILIVGSIGALLFVLWPFFPTMGAVAGVGWLIAFAVYFLTLRGTRRGALQMLLDSIVDRQRFEATAEEEDGEEEPLEEEEEK